MEIGSNLVNYNNDVEIAMYVLNLLARVRLI